MPRPVWVALVVIMIVVLVNLLFTGLIPHPWGTVLCLVLAGWFVYEVVRFVAGRPAP